MNPYLKIDELDFIVNSVKKFINILEKDFLKIVSIKEDNSNNEILIEKEEYLNIGVFFQITKIKKERIILKIKKWKGLTKDDEKLKAVLGHLTLMDDMNIMASIGRYLDLYRFIIPNPSGII